MSTDGGRRFPRALRWWPVVVFIGIGVLGRVYGLGPHKNEEMFNLLRFLLDLGVGLSVVIYVIYTRDLAQSSQVMAEANLEIVRSLRSLLVEEWVAQERVRLDVDLCRGGLELSQVVHLEDLQMPRERYERRAARDRVRVLIFKPLNSGTRLVLLRSVKFQIFLTAAGRVRELAFAPEHPLPIKKEEHAEIHILYDFEGQIDARVVEIDYLDGDRSQNKWVANPWREGRYFEPEGA